MVLFVSLFLILVTGLNCTDSSNVAGGSSDTGNPAVKVSVLMPDRSTVSDVEVSLKTLSVNSGGDTLIREIVKHSDNMGRVEFHTERTLSKVISSDYLGLSCIQSRLGSENETREYRLVLDSCVTLAGRVQGLDSGLVFIPGTGRSTNITESGLYVLDSVPPGEFEIGVIHQECVNYLSVSCEGGADTLYVRDVEFSESGGSGESVYSYYDSEIADVFSVLPVEYSDADMPEWYDGRNMYYLSYLMYEQETSTYTIKREFSGALIDDFEKGWNRAYTYNRFGTHWYTSCDTSQGGDSDFDIGVVSDQDRGSMYLHCEYTLGTEFDYPFVIAGINLDTSGTGLDLTNAERIEFFAKGTSVLRVSLESPIAEDNYSHYIRYVSLNNQWKKFSIDLDSLESLVVTPWDTAAQQINHIEFVAGSGQDSNSVGELLEFSIDDLVVTGILPKEL